MSVLGLAAVAGAALLVTVFAARRIPDLLRAGGPRAVAVVAAASALAAIPAPPDATGADIYDALLRAAFAGALTWVGSKARRWAWVASAGIATAAAGGTAEPPDIAALAVAALAVTAGATLVDVRGRVLGALVAAAVAQTVLRLPTYEPLGTSAALAALAAAPLAVSALRNSRRRVRRRALRVILAAAAIAVVGSTAALAAAVIAREHVNDGIQAALDGLDAAAEADDDTAARHLERAAAAFDLAHDRLGAWWTRPGLAVPVVAQHLRALETMSRSGSRIAGAGAAAARQVDLDALRPRNATIDIAALEAMQDDLAATFEAVDTARRQLPGVRSPWLVDLVADKRDELEDRVIDAYDDAERAALAAELGPELLGAERTRRYLLLVVTPSELRGSGGIVGNWGEVSASNGKLSLDRLERIATLNQASPVAARQRAIPAEYLSRWANYGVDRFWQNVTMSPDFPTVAEVAEVLYPTSGAPPVDGVIAVDPVGLAALLELTGPISVEGWPEPLTEENAARVLLFEQYVAFGESEAEQRVDFLGDAARRAWDRLEAGELPGPHALAGVLGPTVRGRHIQLHAARPAEQRFFATLGADGALPPPRGDHLTVVTQNNSRTKIDWFLRRSYTYDARYDPDTGELTATLTVRLTNTAPATGLPPVVIGPPEVPAGTIEDLQAGETRLYLSIYTPHQAVSARLDGQTIALELQPEAGRNSFSQFVRIGPGATVTVELELVGVLDPDGPYGLHLGVQPLVHPDEVEVVVDDGVGDRLLSEAFELVDDRRLLAETGTE